MTPQPQQLFTEGRRSVSLTLPWPVITNHLYFSMVRNNKIMRIPTPESKKFKEAVARICRVSRVSPFKGDVSVKLDAFRPRKVGDLDGIFKSTFDALSGWAYEDDKQIVEIHARRFEDKVNPRVEIEISEL